MTFLTPIAGIVAASIATPLLLLLYFLKLRRRPVRVSSTLLWERAVRDLQVNAPFRWLRWSFLLLLQLLALAAFCLALARPAVDAQGPAAARQIILIDASASMSARDSADNRSRLDEAKAIALEFIDRLDDGVTASGRRTEAAIITFSAAPRTLTGFTSSRAELRRAIDQVQPTDQPSDLASALKLAQALVMQGRAEDVSTRVTLVGDGAYGDVSAVSLGSAGLRFVRVGPAPGADKFNLGVTALAARRDLDDNSLVRIFARVINASTSPIDTALTLRLDDAPVESREVFAPGATETGPGVAAVTFELREAPTGEMQLATVSIAQRDALASDNTAAVRLDPAIPPRVLIVSPPVMNDAQRLTRDLLVGAVGAIGSTVIETLDTGAFNRLESTPSALDLFDLIIIDGASVAWLPRIPSIQFGGAAPIPGLRFVPRDAQSGAGFASWRRSHPILRQVNLDAVAVAQAARLALPDDPTGSIVPTELAAGADGALIALIRDRGVDRLVVAFELSQSNWPVQVSFVVFLTNAIEQLTRLIGETTGQLFTTNEPITVRPAPGASTINVTGPRAFSHDAPPGATTVNLGAFDRAGVYRLTGVVSEDRVTPVNLLNEGESQIATRDTVRVAGETLSSDSLGAGAPLEVWRWFVLAGLGILTIEWLLYAWRMRV